MILEDQISKQPIIFVANSLGGIILKTEMSLPEPRCQRSKNECGLSSAQMLPDEERSIKLSTYGIVFMGTPHQGSSGVALGQLIDAENALKLTSYPQDPWRPHHYSI